MKTVLNFLRCSFCAGQVVITNDLSHPLERTKCEDCGVESHSQANKEVVITYTEISKEEMEHDDPSPSKFRNRNNLEKL